MLTEIDLISTHPTKSLLCLLLILCGFFQNALGQQPGHTNSSLSALNFQKEQDPAFAEWQSKDKYFLVVTSTKTGGQDTALPYAKVDGKKVRDVLSKIGYKEIKTLSDNDTTRENFVENLKQIGKLNDNGLVIVYYSGHGAADSKGKDLWLQLYGQKYFGEFHGLSVGELINIVRVSGYKGELVLIIDACYSAQGAWTRSLSLSDMENTLIFASSSRTQESFPIEVSSKETMSAFTYYLLEGLTTDWDIVDENHDGIIRYEDLQNYIEAKLTERFIKDDQTEKEMSPEISGQQAKIWAAYNPAKAQNLKSLLRQSISLKSYLKTQLAAVLPRSSQQALNTPIVPQRARELAQRVSSDTDPYTKALKAIAENRNDDALRLLDEAEKSNAAELTDIYQARGSAEIYAGHFKEGEEWYEKALKVNRKENPELFEEAGMVFFIVADLARAEGLIRQALIIREKASKSDAETVDDLFMLGMLELIQGRVKEAKTELQRVQNIVPTILDKQDAISSSSIRVMLAVINLINGKEDEAEKVASEIASLPEDKTSKNDPYRCLALLLLSGIYSKREEQTKLEITENKYLELWAQAVVDKDLDATLLHSNFAAGFQTINRRVLDVEDKLASRFETVCKNSLDLLRTEFSPNTLQIALGLNNLASAYLAQRKYVEAERLFKEALEVSNKTTGNRSLLSVVIYNNLGNLFVELRRYREAEQSFKSALTVAEGMTGQPNSFVEIILEDMAALYVTQDKYDDAASYYQRAIKVSQGMWQGVEVMDTSALEDLADIYIKQKNYADAETLYKQVITTVEKSLGPTHQELESTLVKLGAAYFSQQKYKEAQSILTRAMTIARNNGHTSTPDFASNLIWIAETYLAQKNSFEAIRASKRAIEIAENLPAGQKDEVVQTLIELASNYGEQKDDADSERLYQQVLSLYKNSEDNIRRVVAVHLYMMAQFYVSRGKYDKAEPLYKRAVEIDERAFGKDHIEVAIDLEGLAELYRDIERYNEAVPLYIRSLPIRERTKDKDKIATSLSRLGLLYIQLNRYGEAKPLIKRAIELWEGISDTSSLEFSVSLTRLAVVYYAEQDYGQSEKLLLRALSINKQTVPQNFANIVDDLRLLGNVYRFQRRYGESEEVLRRAREITEKAVGISRTKTAEVLFNLALLYQAQDKGAQAELVSMQALQNSNHLSHAEQFTLSAWLDYYASAMHYMKRNIEAITLETWAKEIRKNINASK